MASVASQLIEEVVHTCKVTISRMCERYAQTVLTFQITYVLNTVWCKYYLLLVFSSTKNEVYGVQQKAKKSLM